MKKLVSLRKHKHNSIIGSLVKFSAALLLIAYVLITYTRIGLLLWEIAPIITIYLLSPIVVGYLIFNKLKQKKCAARKRSILSLPLIFTMLFFYVWAFIPAITASGYAKQFDEIFYNTFGEDYENKIPKEILNKLSKKPFSWSKMIRMEVPNKFTVVRNIYYGNHSRQFFDIYYPLNVSGYRPAIILIHGGATLKGSSNRAIAEVMTAKYFTAQGIIVISVEYRVPPEAHFIEMVTDVRTAIKWIRDHAEAYHINKSQIFVMGRSRGGQLATTAVYSGMNNNTWYMENAGNFTSKDLEVMGVISLYGTVNPYMAKEWGNDYIDNLNEIIFGASREEAPDLYRNCSAEYLIGENTPPTFIMHGSLDKIVYPTESRHLAQALTEKGILNIYLELPTGKHAFDTLPWTPGGQLMYYYLERFIWYLIYNS